MLIAGKEHCGIIKNSRNSRFRQSKKNVSTQGLVRKRLLPVLFSSADELVEWGSEGSSGAAPPAPGSNILDERNGNKKKIGTLVAVSPGELV